MTWFNLPADENLLHSSVRGDSELPNAVIRAQFDTFNNFLEDGEIRLRGYDADPNEADEGLVQAVKMTIADLVSFRLRSYGNTPGIMLQRQGNRTISFAGSRGGGNAEAPDWTGFQPHWDKYLTDYDTRTRLYHV